MYVVHYKNGTIKYPEGWSKNYNASGEPCDMLQGPCCCGATHSVQDWKVLAEEKPDGPVGGRFLFCVDVGGANYWVIESNKYKAMGAVLAVLEGDADEYGDWDVRRLACKNTFTLKIGSGHEITHTALEWLEIYGTDTSRVIGCSEWP